MAYGEILRGSWLGLVSELLRLTSVSPGDFQLLALLALQIVSSIQIALHKRNPISHRSRIPSCKHANTKLSSK
jgi:hypothetical protein